MFAEIQPRLYLLSNMRELSCLEGCTLYSWGLGRNRAAAAATLVHLFHHQLQEKQLNPVGNELGQQTGAQFHQCFLYPQCLMVLVSLGHVEWALCPPMSQLLRHNLDFCHFPSTPWVLLCLLKRTVGRDTVGTLPCSSLWVWAGEAPHLDSPPEAWEQQESSQE